MFRILTILLFSTSCLVAQQSIYGTAFPERMGITTTGFNLKKIITNEKNNQLSFSGNYLTFSEFKNNGKTVPLQFQAMGQLYFGGKKSSREYNKKLWSSIGTFQSLRIKNYGYFSVRLGINRELIKQVNRRTNKALNIGIGLQMVNQSVDLNGLYFTTVADRLVNQTFYQKRFFAPFFSLTFKNQVNETTVFYTNATVATFLDAAFGKTSIINASIGLTSENYAGIIWAGELNLAQNLIEPAYVIASIKSYIPFDQFFKSRSRDNHLILGAQYGTNKVLSISTFVEFESAIKFPFGMGLQYHFFNPQNNSTIPLFALKFYFQF